MKPELELVTNCPLCGASSFSNILSCTDHLVSKELFDLVDCDNCKLRITSPRPKQKDIGAYYHSEDYISHSGSSKGLINTLYLWVRSYALRQKQKLISSYIKEGRLLDYGAGTGDFLAHMRQKGFAVTGIEPDANARKQALSTNRLELIDPRSLADTARTNKYDIITMWHVLEHIHNPNKLLVELGSILSENGILIVAVPNHKSKDANIYKRNWAAYDVPRHLFHFTRSTMLDITKHAELELDKIIPMYFDAYYVSMLSEKNNNGNVLRGALSGLRSNLSARFNSGEYSSLIYVFRKIKP